MKKAGIALGLAVLFGSGACLAQASAPSDFSLQSDPAPAGDRFFLVPAGRVRGLLEAYAMALGDYAYRPMRFVSGEAEPVSRQVYVHLDGAIALADALMLGLSIPMAAMQAGDGGFDQEPGTALGDLRTTLRIAWVNAGEKALSLGTQVDVWFPTGSVEDLSGDGQVRAAPKLSLSGETQSFAYALSAGYLFRKDVDLGTSRVGGAVTFGAGVALLLADGAAQLGPELAGRSVVTGDASLFDSATTPVELLWGGRFRFDNVVLGLAVGPGLSSAPGAAAFRGMLSLTLSADERVLDRDGDGLKDYWDRCPDSPGLTSDGCPPPDRDADTIFDADDACPDTAGLVHIEPAKHGCPP